MEDILQSIRKIIADDGSSPAGDTEVNGHHVMAGAVDEDDVLELTDPLPDEPEEEVSAPAAPIDPWDAVEAMAAPATEESLVTAESILEVVSEEEAEEEVSFDSDFTMPAGISGAFVPPDVPEEGGDGEHLLSDRSEQQVKHVLSQLTQSVTPTAYGAGGMGFRNGTMLEDLVVEALKPLLKQWLDEYLPPTVERIVQREIRRLMPGE